VARVKRARASEDAAGSSDSDCRSVAPTRVALLRVAAKRCADQKATTGAITGAITKPDVGSMIMNFTSPETPKLSTIM